MTICKNKKQKKISKKKIAKKMAKSVFVYPDEIAARLCQMSFEFFVKLFWSTISTEELKWNWHMTLICDELQEIAERVFKGLPKKHDLVINISPGTSKSSICSVLFQAWTWTIKPNTRHICGSHTEPLVFDLSRKSKIVVESALYKKLFPWVVLSDKQNTKGHWVNTRGGDRMSCTVGGKSPIGFHGHILTIDDPIDPKKANSSLELAEANLWMENTLNSRKIDKAVSVIVLVMQRLHEDDPAGRMITRTKVRHLCIPAELTEDVKPKYLRKYYVNNLMDPVRMPKSALLEQEALGAYYYSSQFLQTPTPKGGGLFKVERIITVPLKQAPRKFKKIVRYWDKAATQGGGAHTVGFKMGLCAEGLFWILDVKRVQLESGARERLIKSTAREDQRHTIIGLEQEPGSGGKESTEATIKRLAGYTIKVNKPSGSEDSKVARADPFSVQVNFGNVRMIEGNWNQSLINELRFFPFGKYKDQVDGATGAFSILTGIKSGKRFAVC